MKQAGLWDRFRKYLCVVEDLDLRLDISRMMFDDAFFDRMAEPIGRALTAMDELERGGIANIDEGRMVGHYWLRTPELAPDPKIRAAVQETVERIARTISVSHRQGVHRVRLQLYPPELGSLRVHLTLEGDQLAARLTAETQAARQMLLDHLPTLERSLAVQGIEVRHFQVTTTSEESPTAWQDESGGQQADSPDSGGTADDGSDPYQADADPWAPDADAPDEMPVGVGYESGLNVIA